MQCDCFSYHRMYHNNWQVCGFDVSCVMYSMCVVLFKIFVIRFLIRFSQVVSPLTFFLAMVR